MARSVIAVMSTMLAALLAGCGSAPSATPTPAPVPVEVTTTAMADNTGEWDLVLAEVRAARHEGADRIVMEFEGTGAPGWVVHYVEEPVLEGSGEHAPVGGEKILQVVASGTTYPVDVEEALGQQHVPHPGTHGVADIYLGGSFEGYTQLFVGVDGEQQPFRVSRLADPPRLMVDLVP